MPFGILTHGSMYYIGVKIGRIRSPAARGNKTAMRPFPKLLWTFALSCEGKNLTHATRSS